MTRYVIDTNVPIVANSDSNNDKPVSLDCRKCAVEFLIELMNEHIVLLDTEGEIQEEYRNYLSPSGQPGVGDRFYLEVLNSNPKRVERISLEKLPNGEFADLPQPVIDAGFDPSDRKFAALAKKENSTVVNAIDKDWLDHYGILKDNGISVYFICGCNKETWYEAPECNE